MPWLPAVAAGVGIASGLTGMGLGIAQAVEGPPKVPGGPITGGSPGPGPLAPPPAPNLAPMDMNLGGGQSMVPPNIQLPPMM